MIFAKSKIDVTAFTVQNLKPKINKLLFVMLILLATSASNTSNSWAAADNSASSNTSGPSSPAKPPRGGDTMPVALSADAAVRFALNAYRARSVDGVMALVASNFIGTSERHGTNNRNLLRRSLEHDFGQMSEILLTTRLGVSKPVLGFRRATVPVAWSVKFLHVATGIRVEEQGKKTRFLVIETPQGWRIASQSGDPLFGRSEPTSGRLEPRSIQEAMDLAEVDAEARRGVDRLSPPPIESVLKADDTRPISSWNAEAFGRKVRAAVTAMITSYQDEDVPGVMDHISREYRGVTSQGKTIYYFDLPQSLRCDYEIFEQFAYQANPEVFRIYRDQRKAEVVMLWNARTRYLFTGLDVVERNRRTRLVFVDEGGEAKLLYQQIANLLNGTVMFGQADPSTCMALVRSEAGSQTGIGTQLVSGSSSSSGAAVTPTTVTGAQTFNGDIVVPVGQTRTFSAGSTVTMNGNFKIQVFGTLNTAGATIKGTGTWQGIVFEVGSRGTLTGTTIKNATNGITMNGGSVSATTMTMNTNTRNVNVTGGTLTLGGTITQTGALENIEMTGGTLTLSSATVTGGDRCVDMNASTATLNITGGSSFSGATGNLLRLAGTINISGTNTFTGSVDVASLAAATMTVTGSSTFAQGIFVTGTSTGNMTGATIRSTGGFSGFNLSAIGVPSTWTLTSCIVENCGADGISMIAPASLTVTSSTIRNNTSNGITVNGGTATLSGGTISGNGTNGISMTGGTLTASGTTITTNTSNGFNLTGGAATFNAPAVTMRNNTASGLRATGGTLTATNSNFMNNTSFGIFTSLGCPGGADLTNGFISDNNGAVGAQAGPPGCTGAGPQIGGTGAVNFVTALSATQN